MVIDWFYDKKINVYSYSDDLYDADGVSCDGYSLKYEYNDKCKNKTKFWKEIKIMMNYEVAEEAGMRLVLNTESSGYIELAEVINDIIYVYIDDVDYFDNVDQCEAAERDVDTFVEFWRNKCKKLYNEED